MSDDDFIDAAVAGITNEHVEDKLCQTLAVPDDASFDAMIEAGSLGEPGARMLRARGKRMLYGDSEPDMPRIHAIREDLAADRITDDDARGQLADAGCLPAGVKLHMRLAAS